MILKKKYFQPKIDQIEIDVSISIQMQTEYTPPDDPFKTESAPASEKESSFKETDDSGLNENPFKK